MLTIDVRASALLLIDFQAKLMPAMYEGSAVVANAARLIGAARLFGVPTLFTEQNAKGLGPTVPQLSPDPSIVVHKMTFDACRSPEFLLRVPADRAVKALIPLLRGTLNNLAQVGLPQALTGPIARGDVGTIKRHIEALEEKAPELLSTYRELGLKTLPIALAKGRTDEKRAQEIRKILEGVKP